jgi:hypothetical protein
MAAMPSWKDRSGVVLTLFTAPPALNAIEIAAAATLSGISRMQIASSLYRGESRADWSDRAIAPCTPILLALFSIVTFLAHRLHSRKQLPILQTAWYHKDLPTFSDAVAAVRKHSWTHSDFLMYLFKRHNKKSPEVLLELFSEALCYAA